MAGMTAIEQRRLVRLYLGVSKGYLAKLNSINDLEDFYIQCRLDVNPREIDKGTIKGSGLFVCRHRNKES